MDGGAFANVFCMVSATFKEESGPFLDDGGGTEEEQVVVG